LKLEEEIANIKEKLRELEERLLKLERLLTETNFDKPKKKISVKEFILQKHPKGDVQRTLTVGYYLEKYEDFLSFNVKDLERAFREAVEIVPQNIPEKVRKNIGKGHMMEAEEKKEGLKAYILTTSGEKFIENNFKEERQNGQ